MTTTGTLRMPDASPKAGSLPIVVAQHAEESVLLWSRRTMLAHAPHVKLHHLQRFDDRLAAHLDGLSVAGQAGTEQAWQALENVASAEVFVATVRALEERDIKRLDQVFSLADALPESRPGLVSAFGWISSTLLSGVVRQLLSHADPLRRMVGLATCSMHGVDPGRALADAMDSEDVALRARAYRVAAELGQRDHERALREGLRLEEPLARFWAAWAAALLGDRESALAALGRFCVDAGPYQDRSMAVLLRVLEVSRAHEFLRRIAPGESNPRLLIRGAGIVGDPRYLPWLVDQMTKPELARIAGESLSMITGLDLGYLDLDRRQPEDFQGGPNDDPADSDVSVDPDEDLPWPDAQKLRRWWEANQGAYPQGTRFFAGQAVSRSHCLGVLRSGFQRQRLAAAIHLSLMNPGTALFNVRAPARRQGRRLAGIE